MNTLEMLQKRYLRPALSVAEVMHDWFPHITSERYFLRQVRAKRIQLSLTQHQPGQRTTHFVYLSDLAQYLDAHAPSNKPAADQAA